MRSDVTASRLAQGSGIPVEPSPRRRKRSPSDARRDQARAAEHRLDVEKAVAARRDIRTERDPLARRHLLVVTERHIAADELLAKDRTRKARVEAATRDVDREYEHQADTIRRAPLPAYKGTTTNVRAWEAKTR